MPPRYVGAVKVYNEVQFVVVRVALCVSIRILFSKATVPPIVVSPVISTVFEKVVAPVTSMVFANVEPPVTFIVFDKVVTPVTFIVFDSVTAPVTPTVLENVPAPVTFIVFDKVVAFTTRRVSDKVTEPETLAVPTTCNLAFGVAVPIPVLEPESTFKLVPCTVNSLVPSIKVSPAILVCPDTLAVPTTCNLALGFDVPIPTSSLTESTTKVVPSNATFPAIV